MGAEVGSGAAVDAVATTGRAARRAPGPAPHPLFGHIPAFRRDPLGFLVTAARDYGDIVALRIGRRPAYLLRHPDHIQHVLQTAQHNYPKQAAALQRISLVLGQGLVTSAGELWRRQRRVIQPAFHPERLAGFGPVMARAVAEVAARWQPDGGREPVDLHHEMMRLTFQVVGEALFSTDLRGVADVVRTALALIQEQTSERLFSLFQLPLAIPTARNRAFRAAVTQLDRVVVDLIAQRRAGPQPGADLLAALLAARDEATGAPMPDRQMRDEILTLLLAGHENTGNALTWMWYLVGTHPDVEQRLHAELAGVLGGRTPTWEDLAALPYARTITEETLRLYPTSWLLLRRAVAADVIGGYRIPAGAVVLISPYVTHRDPGQWPHPERFDPERFTGGGGAAERHRFAYLPFGGGSRKCIGSGFAAGEMHLILASLAQRYRLEPLPAHRAEAHPVVSLPPRGGLPMRVRPRV